MFDILFDILDEYRPRPFHFFLPMTVMAIGGFLVHKLGYGFDILLIASAPFYTGAMMCYWMAASDIIRRQCERDRDDPQPVKETKPEPKQYKDLAEPVYGYQTLSANLVQKDLRWQQFAQDVIEHHTPMTQGKWTGKNRPFSKGEFSIRMNKWLEDKVVKPKNPKNHNNGFVLNGGAGHRYFHELARGTKWISLPLSD